MLCDEGSDQFHSYGSIDSVDYSKLDSIVTSSIYSKWFNVVIYELAGNIILDNVVILSSVIVDNVAIYESAGKTHCFLRRRVFRRLIV